MTKQVSLSVHMGWVLSLWALAASVSAAAGPAVVVESARDIPVIFQGDVVVVGGSSGAVSAAMAASEAGAKVFLLAPRTYLGEDICESRRLWLEAGETPLSPLAKRLYSHGVVRSRAPAGAPPATAVAELIDVADPVRLVRPMHVKHTLDQALLESKVVFLFSCFATELLRDAKGQPCGIVMANRAGRQAVLAKVLVDATPRAMVARMAGAQFAAFPAGKQTFQRVVIGGDLKSGPGFSGRKSGFDFSSPPAVAKGPPGKAELIEYTLSLPMPDASVGSFAAADQLSRDLLWHPQMLEMADGLFQVPPDPVKAIRPASGPWQGALALDLDCVRPKGVSRLYVLGGCADMDRESAAKLLRPLALMELGRRIGQAAASEAKSASPGKAPRVAGAAELKDPGEKVLGEVRETLAGVRPGQRDLPRVPSPQRALPVLGRYDVVVIGGGTGGAPAGISASRGGAKTLLVEYLPGLGGVGTQGRIIRYWYGYRGGFTREVDDGIKGLGAGNYVLGKAEWWRRTNRQAGTEIWLGAIGSGALVEKGLVKGVVVATPLGRGVVLAKTVIDATGNADIAVAAGAESDYTAGEDVAVQGAGLPPLQLGDHYTNTDWTFADDTDIVDSWHHYVTGRAKFRGAYDLGQLLDTRERRRIVGDVVISPMDIVLGRQWPDTIHRAESNFDTHGFTIHPMFFAMPPGHERIVAWVPFRALLPRGLDGILVTGLGVSAHRDAMPVIRMQADVQNQGYACGRAAAMVAQSGATIRQVDLRALQQHLAEVGVLPNGLPPEKDAFPLPREKVAAAVSELLKPEEGVERNKWCAVKNFAALAIVFAHPAEAQPLLKKAHATASRTDKLGYALVLGLMGDPVAADTLLEHIRRYTKFDKGWNYTGMGQFGRCVSPLDECIIALGRTRDPRALEVVIEKVKLLDATKEFSHHRACAMALETLHDPRAAAPLAALLQKPGMTGYAFEAIDAAVRAARNNPDPSGTKDRNDSLRELVLARALYRCGDKDGVGQIILAQYAKDLRGHYARHARAILEEPGAK